MSAEIKEITRLLIAHQEGDRIAFDQLVPLVYQDLKRIAHRQLSAHRRGQLDTTSLVHEAYFRLVDHQGLAWESRAHFYAVAARAMRQIIVDYARRRLAAKRGGDRIRISLDPQRLEVESQSDVLLAIDEALDRLRDQNDRQARIVECRFFGGLTEDEVATALAVSKRTVQRDWREARDWLKRELGSVA